MPLTQREIKAFKKEIAEKIKAMKLPTYPHVRAFLASPDLYLTTLAEKMEVYGTYAAKPGELAGLLKVYSLFSDDEIKPLLY